MKQFILFGALVCCFTWPKAAASEGDSSGDKKECMIDASKGWFDPSNVYSCLRAQSCCKEYGKPSCCASKPTLEIVQEQLLLWGGLFSFLTLLAVLIYCRRTDVRLCEGRKINWSSSAASADANSASSHAIGP